MSWDITIHHLTDNPAASISENILQDAHALVDASTSSSANWQTPSPSSFYYSTSSKAQCFMFARRPPQIDSKPMKTLPVSQLPDWDAPFSDDGETTDLPEFENTNFNLGSEHNKHQSTKRKLPSRNFNVGDRQFANDVDINSERRPYKRTSPPSPVTFLSTPISTLVAFPHYHASPYPANPPPPGINKIPEFRVKRRLLHVHLNSPFTRTAWLIPLRGDPVIDGASNARLYKLLPPDKSHDAIQWTPHAVTQFWSFLLRQRSMNNFGPLAIAYISGLSAAMNEKPTRRETQQNVWEYIKIYHDSRYALKLRSLLDSFRWEDRVNEYRTHQTHQYRVLKGSTLILVNDSGNPILLA